MQRMRFVVGAVVFALLSALAVERALPDEEETPKGTPEEDLPAWNEFMQRIARTGEEHRWLAMHTGEWDVAAKHWHAPGDPMAAEGKARFEMILDGHHLRQRYSTSFQGMEFEGVGQISYSVAEKAFVMTWVDSFNTSVVIGRGTLDEEKKVLTLRGTSTGPFGEYEWRWTEAWTSENAFTFTGHYTRNGQERLEMELRYTRVPAGAR